MAKPRFKASAKAGVLFKAEARVDFMTITSRQYQHMQERARKDLKDPEYRLPFNLDAYRQDVLSVLSEGKKDGAIQCRYCRGFFVIGEVSPDHHVPLAFDPSGLGLENLDYPCMNCNRAKGPMMPGDFLKLIDFLERELPLAKADLLGRLSKAISLAVAARRAHSKLRALEQANQSPQAPRPAQPRLEAPF